MKRVIVFCIALLLLLGCTENGKNPENAQAPAPAPAEAQTASTEAQDQPVETQDQPAKAQAEPVEAPVSQGTLAQKLSDGWKAEGLLEDMFPYAPEDVLDLYGIDCSGCWSAAAFGDAVGYANEAIIVEADAAVLDEVESLLQDHLDAVKAQYRGYDAEALALAEKAVFLREGNAVLLIISPAAERMLAVYRGLTA